MRARTAFVLMIVLACSACTTETVTVSAPASSAAASPTTTLSPTGATLADGSALPASCEGKQRPSQTVAFVADGRAWAMDPRTQTLSCLFEVTDPGPFSFGPQGDRVLLADLQVQGVGPDAPTWPAGHETPPVYDWGHPIGLAIVYSDGGDPRKRFMDDGHTEKLSELPSGAYQAIAYHPSGLALGFIVDEGSRQGIWISTNEGKDPERLVYSKPDTVFSSVAFSPDGQRIWWIAQHAGALSEIHYMDLDDRSGFSTVLSRGLAPTAHGLLLAPSGPLMAATQGASCGEEQAMVIDDQGAHAVGPSGAGPTHAIGWLDARTLLVAQGGCGQPVNLYAITWHGSAPAAGCWSPGSTSGRPARSSGTRRPRSPHRPTTRRPPRPGVSGDSAHVGRPVGRPPTHYLRNTFELTEAVSRAVAA